MAKQEYLPGLLKVYGQDDITVLPHSYANNYISIQA